MNQREQHLIKEQEAKRKKEAKHNVKNCDNCEKEYCDDVYFGFSELCGYEGSEED